MLPKSWIAHRTQDRTQDQTGSVQRVMCYSAHVGRRDGYNLERLMITGKFFLVKTCSCPLPSSETKIGSTMKPTRPEVAYLVTY